MWVTIFIMTMFILLQVTAHYPPGVHHRKSKGRQPCPSCNETCLSQAITH